MLRNPTAFYSGSGGRVSSGICTNTYIESNRPYSNCIEAIKASIKHIDINNINELSKYLLQLWIDMSHTSYVDNKYYNACIKNIKNILKQYNYIDIIRAFIKYNIISSLIKCYRWNIITFLKSEKGLYNYNKHSIQDIYLLYTSAFTKKQIPEPEQRPYIPSNFKTNIDAIHCNFCLDANSTVLMNNNQNLCNEFDMIKDMFKDNKVIFIKKDDKNNNLMYDNKQLFIQKIKQHFDNDYNKNIILLIEPDKIFLAKLKSVKDSYIRNIANELGTPVFFLTNKMDNNFFDYFLKIDNFNKFDYNEDFLRCTFSNNSKIINFFARIQAHTKNNKNNKYFLREVLPCWTDLTSININKECALK